MTPIRVPAGGVHATDQEVENLRAQLAHAQKRDAVSAELRQLAETYKTKAERLGKQLIDEREKAAAQGDLWKQQLQKLRERSRVDKEHARQLEERLRHMMRSPSAMTPSPRSQDGRPRYLATMTPSSTSPRSTPKSGLKGRVLSTASSLDAKVDRAFDRVDGLVERLARNTKTNFSPLSMSEAEGR